MRVRDAFLLFAVLALGCGDDDGSPGGGDDAGPGDDGGPPDAGGPDCTGRPADAPGTRGESTGVLDAARGRILVYGGNTAAPAMCMPATTITDELWAFHLDCASWERLDAAGPGLRTRAASAVDTMRDRMIVFGGRRRPAGSTTGYVMLNDVWAFDFATNTWSEIATSGTPPSARNNATMVYDAGRDRVLVFGGDTARTAFPYEPLGDLFALDLATGTWSQIDAPGAPEPRLFHAATIAGGEMIIHGGLYNFDGPYLADTHAFDLAAGTWREVAAAGVEGRFGPQIFFDQAGNRILLFAGHDLTMMGNRNDVWALDLAAGTWSEVRPGDTYNGGSTGFCMFPPDFTTPEENSPERRYSFVAAQNATTGYVFGGKTDCGNVNDVWSIDLTIGTWTQLRPATDGEACNRTGATTCTQLCF